MIVWRVEEFDLIAVEEVSPIIEVLPLRVAIVADGVRNCVDDAKPITFKEPVLSMVTAPLRVAIVADAVRNEVEEATPKISRLPFREMLPLRVEMVAEVERRLLAVVSPERVTVVVDLPIVTVEVATLKKVNVLALF